MKTDHNQLASHVIALQNPEHLQHSALKNQSHIYYPAHI